jgi:hypothetical protein
MNSDLRAVLDRTLYKENGRLPVGRRPFLYRGVVSVANARHAIASSGATTSLRSFLIAFASI